MNSTLVPSDAAATRSTMDLMRQMSAAPVTEAEDVPADPGYEQDATYYSAPLVAERADRIQDDEPVDAVPVDTDPEPDAPADTAWFFVERTIVDATVVEDVEDVEEIAEVVEIDDVVQVDDEVVDVQIGDVQIADVQIDDVVQVDDEVVEVEEIVEDVTAVVEGDDVPDAVAEAVEVPDAVAEAVEVPDAVAEVAGDHVPFNVFDLVPSRLDTARLADLAPPIDLPRVADLVAALDTASPVVERVTATAPAVLDTPPVTRQPARRRTSPRIAAILAPPPVRLEPTRLQTARAAITGSRVAIVVALLLWIVSLPSLRDAESSNYGLLFAGTPLFTLAALITVLAFCSAIRRGRFGDAVAALLAWIVIVRVTVSVITPMPIYTWTYKHLGVIDYIQQHGHLAPGTDIYMAWPGAFTAIAWFSSVTGVAPIVLAQWFAVGIHLAIALGVYALGRAAYLSPTSAITAAFLAEILNWVGQDYLSPQAVAFVLSLFVLTLLLRSRESALAGWLSVPVFAAIVVTHQLTPYWLLLIVFALGVGRAVRPRWLIAGYAAVALAYLAAHLGIAAQYGLLSSFDPLANAESNVSAQGSAGHDFTALMVRIPAVLLWGTTALAAARVWRTYRRRRKLRQAEDTRPGHPRWMPIVMAFASFSLLAGQSYGGEAIFRVFLYSLPGCTLVVAPMLVRVLLSSPGRTGRVRRFVLRPIAVACVIVAAATSLQGYYGGWFTNLVRRDSVNEVELLMSTLPTNSFILPMTSGMPERPVGRYSDFTQVNRFFDAPVQLLPGIDPTTDTAAQIAAVLQRRGNGSAGPIYLVITAQMREYSAYYGIFRPGLLTALPKLLRTNGFWWTISDTPTLQVFRLVNSGR